MPAPLPLLQLPNADGATVSQKNSISPDATDTSSSSSQGVRLQCRITTVVRVMTFPKLSCACDDIPQTVLCV